MTEPRPVRGCSWLSNVATWAPDWNRSSYAAVWVRTDHTVGRSMSYSRITKRTVIGFRVTLRRST